MQAKRAYSHWINFYGKYGGKMSILTYGMIGLAIWFICFVLVLKIVSINEPTNELEKDLEDYENQK
jgi:hypothetical protein